MHARATEPIVEDGRLFAEKGDIGEVHDAVTEPDGTHALLVAFPNAPHGTTCHLGVNVEFISNAA